MNMYVCCAREEDRQDCIQSAWVDAVPSKSSQPIQLQPFNGNQKQYRKP